VRSLPEQALIIIVRTDPKPGDRVILKQPNSAVVYPDARGVHRPPSANALKVEPWMRRIGAKLPVRFTRVTLSVDGQLVEESPEGARGP
jgi:hypothetical protein